MLHDWLFDISSARRRTRLCRYRVDYIARSTRGELEGRFIDSFESWDTIEDLLGCLTGGEFFRINSTVILVPAIPVSPHDVGIGYYHFIVLVCTSSRLRLYCIPQIRGLYSFHHIPYNEIITDQRARQA